MAAPYGYHFIQRTGKRPPNFAKSGLRKMNDLMGYKGFTARVGFSDDDKAFVGRLVGIEDIVAFDGETIDEVRKRFREAVDFHIEVCDRTDEKLKGKR